MQLTFCIFTALIKSNFLAMLLHIRDAVLKSFYLYCFFQACFASGRRTRIHLKNFTQLAEMPLLEVVDGGRDGGGGRENVKLQDGFEPTSSRFVGRCINCHADTQTNVLSLTADYYSVKGTTNV